MLFEQIAPDRYANCAAPASVNFMNVPLSCSHSQPLAMARSSPALYSAGVTLQLDMQIRPSCTGSKALASSTILRAATSGLEKGRSATNFMSLSVDRKEEHHNGAANIDYEHRRGRPAIDASADDLHVSLPALGETSADTP